MATSSLAVRRRSAPAVSPSPAGPRGAAARRHSATHAPPTAGGPHLPSLSPTPSLDSDDEGDGDGGTPECPAPARTSAPPLPPNTPPRLSSFVHPPHSAGPSRRTRISRADRTPGASLPGSPTAEPSRASLRALSDHLVAGAGGLPGAPYVLPCPLEVLGEDEGHADEPRKAKRERGWARARDAAVCTVLAVAGVVRLVPIVGGLAARVLGAAAAVLASELEPTPPDPVLALSHLVADTALACESHVPVAGRALAWTLRRTAMALAAPVSTVSATPELDPSSTLPSTPDVGEVPTPPPPATATGGLPPTSTRKTAWLQPDTVRLLGEGDTFPSNPYPGEPSVIGLDTGAPELLKLGPGAVRT